MEKVKYKGKYEKSLKELLVKHPRFYSDFEESINSTLNKVENLGGMYLTVLDNFAKNAEYDFHKVLSLVELNVKKDLIPAYLYTMMRVNHHEIFDKAIPYAEEGAALSLYIKKVFDLKMIVDEAIKVDNPLVIREKRHEISNNNFNTYDLIR